MSFQQREAGRLLACGLKYKEICQRIGINASTLHRWRGIPEFIEYVKQLEAERERQEIELGAHRRASGVEPVDKDGHTVDEQIRALSQEAIVRLRSFVHHENARISLSASVQVLALAGFVPPARKPSVQPNDAAARRGSALARLSAQVPDDEGCETPVAEADGVEG